MNDSEQEGFYEPIVQTFTQCLLKYQINPIIPNNQHFKSKPALCVHYQLTLFPYPQQIDKITNLYVCERIGPNSSYPLDPITKIQGESKPLSEFFPRNLQCLYNKFHEKLMFKRDLTLIIRNVTRQVRDEQVITFDSIRQPPSQALTFSSDFECGNLHLVFKQRKQQTYYLLLQNDVNTHGFNFWFYFNIRSKQRRKCNFVIVNLSRIVSFQKDATIFTYSYNTKRMERKVGFVTTASQFCRCDNEQAYWSLLFQYQFDGDSDIYFSLTLPYSYSKVIKFLKSLNEINHKTGRFIIEAAGKSPLNNIIPVIKIQKQRRHSKKIILITARQHPSQTVGSYVCESIISALCSKSQLSDALLDRFRFIILPMVNVDGVIHGNSRTNLMGYDLNRCWGRSGIIQSAECEQIWKYLQSIQGEERVIWSFDLHGHSRQPGFFAYFSEENQKSLVMTHLLSTKSPIFKQNKCVYEIGPSKRQSIRGQLYQRMKIKNAVTIQISLFGYFDENQQFCHFQARNFDEIGNSILESLHETEKMSQKRILKHKNWQDLIKKMEKDHEKDKQIDSDSNPEGDYLKKEQRKEVEQQFNLFQLSKKNNIAAKRSSSNFPYSIQRKKMKTEGSKCRSQRSSPSRQHIPIKINVRKSNKSPAENKIKLERGQIFNLTFTNRFKFSNKNILKSQQFSSQHQAASHHQHDQINNKQKQFKCSSPHRSNNNNLQSQTNLQKSLDMRKRIKLAFQSRHKTQKSIYISNLIDPSNITKIKAIVYPSIKQKDKLDVASNLKSKRQLTKQLRNQSFGVNLQARFHNSFYLKAKNPG